MNHLAQRLATAVALALVALALPARAESARSPITIGVSPPRFEIDLAGAPKTHALRVFNFGSQPVEVFGSVRGWDLDDDNRVRVVEPDEQSLEQWIILNPLHFSIPPGESQTVRFSIRPKVRPAPGEHRAMIYFEQPPASEESITIRGRMGIAVYAYEGAVERIGRLNGVVVEPGKEAPRALFDISSTGSAHVRMSGQYAIWRAATYPGFEATASIERLGEEPIELPSQILNAGYLPGLPVLPGDRRSLPLHLPAGLPEGDYVLDINGDLNGKPLDMAIRFHVASRDARTASK